jgi:hypothetical protein
MGNQLSYEDLFDNITKGVASNTKIEYQKNKQINTEIKYKIYFKDIISGKQQEIKGLIQNDNGPSNEEVIQKKLEKYYKDTLTFDKLPSILSQPKDIEKIKIKVATGILIYLKSIKKNIESLLKWLETKRKNKKSNNNISEEEKNKLNVLLEKLNEKLKTAEELGQKEIIEELEKLKEKIEKKLNISKNKSKQNINN